MARLTAFGIVTACAIGLFDTVAHGEDSGPLSFPRWEPLATEYTRVQSGDWIDKERFVIGRWDGSVAVFEKPALGSYETPRLLDIRRTSDGSGVELVIALKDGYVVSSDGNAQLRVWKPGDPSPGQAVAYDAVYGPANSATETEANGQHLLVTGHQEGYLLVWSYQGGRIALQSTIDLRSQNPIPSPYPLKNIRGVAEWSKTKVIAGSEDGDLTMIDVTSGKILLRQRYNSFAQRGINSISVLGDFLLVANCSVGRTDSNLWLFRIEPSQFVLLDSVNLIDDQARPQSFDFDADLANILGKQRFFASTEEGYLWTGTVENNRLAVFKSAFVASEGGALLDISPDGSTLVAAADKVFLFDTTYPAK